MVADKVQGKIVFVSSTVGFIGFAGYSAYAPAKAAVRCKSLLLYSNPVQPR